MQTRVIIKQVINIIKKYNKRFSTINVDNMFNCIIKKCLSISYSDVDKVFFCAKFRQVKEALLVNLQKRSI